MAEPNPYVGPRPFQIDDRSRFYGRDGEINQLVPLLYAHRLTVLFAQSGAGKTSLLNAGVLPVLIDDEGFEVLGRDDRSGNSTRVSGVGAKEAEAAGVRNIYTYNALSGWLPADQTPAGDATLASSLAQRAHLADAAGDPAPRLAIFDQFEEVFTAYPDRWQERDDFFRQLREALDADPMLRVVLSLREDYLANLDPHLAVFRGVSTLTFRLERLRKDAALSAVVDPLRDTSRSFAKGVAEKLVTDLMQVRVERDGELVRVDGEYAEPVQLQVVCARLWDALPAGVTQITEANLANLGGIDQALTDFYEEALPTAVKKGGVKEAKLRDWFDRTLITSAGTRSSVYQDQQANSTGGMPNAVVQVLEDAHIVRGETLRGSRWYELTHDRFVGPIREANADFRHARRAKRVRWAAIAAVAVVLLAVGAAAYVALNPPEASLEAEAIDPTGEAVLRTAEPGVVQRFRFDGRKDDAATVRLSSDDLDVVNVRLLAVVDEALADQLGSATAVRGRPEAGGDGGSGSAASTRRDDKRQEVRTAQTASAQLVRRLPADGSFVIEVIADRSGSFTLTAEVAPDQRDPLPIGQAVQGVLAHEADVDEWVVTGATAGQLVQVALQPAGFLDAVIELRTSSGEQLGLADAGGAADGEYLAAEIPAGGEYVVAVSGFEGSTGIYRLQLATAPLPVLDAGTVERSTIAEPYSVATYAFAGSEGEAVVLSLEAVDGKFDATLSVTTLTGEELSYADSGGDGEREVMVLQLPEGGGRFLVTVAGYQASVGDFSLQLARRSDIDPLEPNQAVAGQLGPGGSVELYRLEANAGDLVELGVTLDPGVEAEVAIGGPGVVVGVGSNVDVDGVGGFVVSGVVPVSGSFLVSISAIGDSGGGYELDLGEPTVSTVAVGDIVDGSVEVPGEVDYYRLSSEAGKGLEIVVEPDDPELFPFVILYAPGSAVPPGAPPQFEPVAFSLDTADGGALLEAELLEDGDYLVLVITYPDTGSYRMTFTDIDPFRIALGGFPEDGGDGFQVDPIAPGESLGGELAGPDATAFYQFDGTAGDRVDVVVEPNPSLDVAVYVVDETGEIVAEADMGFEGDAEALSGALPADGSYLIVVAEFEPGAAADTSFTVTLDPGTSAGTASDAAADVLSISAGDVLSGELDAATESLVYVFTASVGDVVDVVAEPRGDLDVVVLLVDAERNIVAEVDEGGNGDVETLLDVVLGTGGDVYIVVEEFAPGTAEDGAFTLTLDVR